MRTIKGLLVCLAVLGVCLPQPIFAAAKGERAPVVFDVKLHKGPQGNVLMGQVQNQQGKTQPNVPVVLLSNGRKIAEGRTNHNGYFAFSNLRGGVYQVVSAGGVGAYRVWTPGTAPPSAQQGALVVAGKDLIRGQWGMGRLRFWLSHPAVIAALVITAVAVPVAIHNCGDDGPHSP